MGSVGFIFAAGCESWCGACRSRPSREVLAAENAQLRKLVAALQGQVAGLTARLDALEAENTALRAENAELKRRLGPRQPELVEAAVDGFPVRQARAQFVAPQERPQAGRATWASGVDAGAGGRPQRAVAARARPVRRLRQRFGGRTRGGHGETAGV